MRGNPFGGGGQLVAWGEKGVVAEKFLLKLTEVLPSVSEPPSLEPRAAGGSDQLADQLAELARLQGEGAISAAEFKAAKAKLLG